MTNRTNKTSLIPPHGGYRKLLSYQTAEIIYDLTVQFCEKYIRPIGQIGRMGQERIGQNRSYRTSDQMVQAARSGKQNIAEGCQASGTSKKTELKLLGVARASLEELLQDFEDFLRQRSLPCWGKEHPSARKIRALAYRTNRTYKTYTRFLAEPETAANAAICLIHQANYLLDRQLRALEESFLKEGGFTERLYQRRVAYRREK